MLKAFIIGADSVSPDIILNNLESFPTLSKMINSGAMASYSAYVQKGYQGSYSSEQNWSSIYTGLSPSEHLINTTSSRGEKRCPQMKDFNGLMPFWKVLNDHKISVGLWAADNCTVPIEIYGYVASTKYTMISTPLENRKAPRELQVCKKDYPFIKKILDKEPPFRLYPKTLSQQGYSFEELKSNLDLAEQVIEKYHFQDSLGNFKEELDYWFEAMRKAQHINPVDVQYFYTPTTDLIAHCCMHCDNNDILIAAYKMLDKYIGEFIEEFNPEVTVFLSDHGQQNFKELIKCSDPVVQKQAFSARDEVIWLKNGYIAFHAHNGALLFTAHALKGTFIAAGRGICHTSIDGMRTVDIWPTLLEIFDIPLPDCRSGFVMDIFHKNLINKDKLFRPNDIKYKSIGILQTHSVSVTDIIINELYIANRFADIIVIGEPKYEEIYRGNPRVYNFVPFENFIINNFDEVYCGYYDDINKQMEHIKIYERK